MPIYSGIECIKMVKQAYSEKKVKMPKTIMLSAMENSDFKK